MGRAGSTVAPILLFHTLSFAISYTLTLHFDAMIITDPHAQIAALIEGIRDQKSKVEYEESVLKARQEMLLELMDSNGFDRIKTDKGSVTVCKGKRTVVVIDPALKAEIKLIQERGVRTGRCEERIGQRYCMIRR
jgi:hypothetical protein